MNEFLRRGSAMPLADDTKSTYIQSNVYNFLANTNTILPVTQAKAHHLNISATKPFPPSSINAVCYYGRI